MELYEINIKNNNIKKVNSQELHKIKNLIYDMGGGESSYYDEKNIVIIDNIDINTELGKKTVIDGIEQNSNAETKLYIQHDLNIYYKFPLSNKIIISQLLFYIKNIQNLAKIVNDCLKSGGIVEFFSSKMYKEDINFLKILIEKYNFFLPSDMKMEDLKQYKEITITLRKNEKYNIPLEILKYKIQSIDGKEEGIITYKNTSKGWEEKIEGIDPKNITRKNQYPIYWGFKPDYADNSKLIVPTFGNRSKYKIIKNLNEMKILELLKKLNRK